MAQYNVVLYSPLGQRLALLPVLSVQYVLAVNTVCALEVVLPASFDRSYLSKDAILEVWRAPDGGAAALEGDKRWFVRGWRYTVGLETTISVRAVCALDLVRRRIIAYDAGTSYTEKSAPADDMLKELWRENLTTGISAANRDTSTYASVSEYLQVAANAGMGPSLSLAAARDNLLDTSRRIAEASATAGTYLAYDVIWDGARLFGLTYIGQRGADRRAGAGAGAAPVILAPELNNLADAAIVEDYTQEITVAIAGGQGVGASRTVATAIDTARVEASPYAAAEVFAQSNMATSAAGVLDTADARLRAGRPLRVVSGTVQETPQTKYGVHWGWGDRVTVQIDGESWPARLDVVRVSRSATQETVTAEIRIDD